MATNIVGMQTTETKVIGGVLLARMKRHPHNLSFISRPMELLVDNSLVFLPTGFLFLCLLLFVFCIPSWGVLLTLPVLLLFLCLFPSTSPYVFYGFIIEGGTGICSINM